MSNLTREDLSKPIAVGRETVPVPEFGEGKFVTVVGMTAREKNEHDAWVMKPKWDGVRPERAKKQKEHMIVRCLRDDNGKRIFSDDDLSVVQEWPADLANRIFDVANRLSGGASDDAVKNSDTTGDE